MIRLMDSGGWYHHKEPDYSGVRYKKFDSDMRRGLREEYPDFKIKIRKRRYF